MSQDKPMKRLLELYQALQSEDKSPVRKTFADVIYTLNHALGLLSSARDNVSSPLEEGKDLSSKWAVALKKFRLYHDYGALECIKGHEGTGVDAILTPDNASHVIAFLKAAANLTPEELIEINQTDLPPEFIKTGRIFSASNPDLSPEQQTSWLIKHLVSSLHATGMADEIRKVETSEQLVTLLADQAPQFFEGLELLKGRGRDAFSVISVNSEGVAPPLYREALANLPKAMRISVGYVDGAPSQGRRSGK